MFENGKLVDLFKKHNDFLKTCSKEERKNLIDESLKNACKIAEQAGEEKAWKVDEMYNRVHLWPMDWGIGR